VILALLGAFAAAVLYGVATVLQAVGLRRLAAATAPTWRGRISAGWLYGVGLALDGAGFLASVAALRSLPLFVVESAIASSVAVTAILSAVFLGGRLDRASVLALVVVGIGLVALAVCAEEGPGKTLSTPTGVLVLVLTIPVALLGVIGFRLPPERGVPVLALVAGLGFGGSGVAARTLELESPWWRILGEPLAWALVVFGAIAIVAFGVALQRGSVTLVAAVTFGIETVVPAAVGLLWLGDLVRPGFAWVTALGFVLTLGGSIRLARFAAAESLTKA
jgi:drug/metabolite transporter (DMT)-like permease